MKRLVIAIGLLLIASPAFAQMSSVQAKAKQFLDAKAQGEDVLVALHFGAGYKSHTFIEAVAASDTDGGRGFWMKYVFTWDDRMGGTGHTLVLFGVNARGTVSSIQVGATDAVFSPPFVIADGTLTVTRDALVELAKDKMSADDYAKFKTLMDILKNASAVQMLIAYLQFELLLKGIG